MVPVNIENALSHLWLDWVCAWGSGTVFLLGYARELAHDEGHIFLQHSVPRRHLRNIFLPFFFMLVFGPTFWYIFLKHSIIEFLSYIIAYVGMLN